MKAINLIRRNRHQLPTLKVLVTRRHLTCLLMSATLRILLISDLIPQNRLPDLRNDFIIDLSQLNQRKVDSVFVKAAVDLKGRG